jgi:Cof subfamily protein (haloacid dehalogenase superfamily)
MELKSKKDLSDWLVVSDIDGTLNSKFRKLLKRNFDAISHFVSDLGGHFTLASGRNVESLEKHFKKLPISGTPAIVLNGAGIYSFDKNEFILYNSINEQGREIVKYVSEKINGIEIAVFTKDMIYLLNDRLFVSAIVNCDNLKYKKCNDISQIPPENWGKVIFAGVPHALNSAKKIITEIPEPHASFMSSSIVTYEMLAENTNKGSALKELAGLLGIDYEHTATIGDYFNDFEMLRSVFLSAACGQSPKEIKDAARFIACHCNKGSVGDLLEYIERTYL